MLRCEDIGAKRNCSAYTQKAQSPFEVIAALAKCHTAQNHNAPQRQPLPPYIIPSRISTLSYIDIIQEVENCQIQEGCSLECIQHPVLLLCCFCF